MYGSKSRGVNPFSSILYLMAAMGSEISTAAQARDLDVDCLAVWLNPTVLGVRHEIQEERCLDVRAPLDLFFSPPATW
jgi:hypothetical protein